MQSANFLLLFTSIVQSPPLIMHSWLQGFHWKLVEMWAGLLETTKVPRILNRNGSRTRDNLVEKRYAKMRCQRITLFQPRQILVARNLYINRNWWMYSRKVHQARLKSQTEPNLPNKSELSCEAFSLGTWSCYLSSSTVFYLSQFLLSSHFHASFHVFPSRSVRVLNGTWRGFPWTLEQSCTVSSKTMRRWAETGTSLR